MTLHSFLGLQLAQGPAEYLIQKVKRFPRVMARIKSTELLIVDEISMVEAAFFDKLEAVARAVRGRPREAFGGMQLVVVGDFLQVW